MADEFTFNDHGIGLEFKDKERLAEFFRIDPRSLPRLFPAGDAIFVSGDRVITEWTLQFTLTEPFCGSHSRKLRVSLRGASIVRTANGKITNWAEYYDGLTSRRTALASYFTEWVEL